MLPVPRQQRQHNAEAEEIDKHHQEDDQQRRAGHRQALQLGSCQATATVGTVTVMGIYVTHAEKDRDLAQQFALQLGEAGGETTVLVQDPLPGDHWTAFLVDDLRFADWRVAIMTPGSAAASDRLRTDFELVGGDLPHRDRLTPFPVDPAELTAQIPWVFTQVDTIQITEPRVLTCTRDGDPEFDPRTNNNGAVE